MKISLASLFLLIAAISGERSYEDTHCTFYRHVKPIENLDFLVCAIDIELPPHVRVVANFNNEPIRGLVVGGQREIFDKIGTYAFQDVTYFALLKHEIETLAKENLTDLAFLEGLDISNGNLMRIDFDALYDLVHLRDLDFSRNKLDYLHPQLFTTLKDLEKISLNDNSLMAIERDMFANNKKLTLINLRNNKIAYVYPRVFETLYALRELYLSGNNCINVDYKPPRIQALRNSFTQMCREDNDLMELLSEKRVDAEGGDYENENENE